jgi:hypothetical protein
MAPLDSLPPDQRAVLQLVLQQGRSYDQIAQMLSIERDVVRERAHAALDALGPDTRVPEEQRAPVADYLLGQLPDEAAGEVRGQLATSPTARAWARVLASELGPLAKDPLPEIPVEQAAGEPEPIASVPAAAGEPEPIAPVPAAAGEPAPSRTAQQPASAPRSSRTGGAILLGAGALIAIIVVVVVIIIVTSSGGSSHHTTTVAHTSTPTTTGTTTSASTSGATPIAAVTLKSPTHTKGTAGFAEVVKQGGKTGLVLVAQGVPANTSHDAYAVWLYNTPADSHILGFVNPGVKTDGRLQTAGVLPANAGHFKQLLVTLETQSKPHGPGKVVLQGALKLSQ